MIIIVNLYVKIIVRFTILNTKKWDYQGYSSLDSLYRAIVNNNGDIYNYEDNITQ